MGDPNRPMKKNTTQVPPTHLSASHLTTPIIPTAFPVSSFISNFPSGAGAGVGVGSGHSHSFSAPGANLSHSLSFPDLATIGSASRRRHTQQVDITSHEQFPTLAAGIQVKQSKRKHPKKKEFDEDKVGEGSNSSAVIAEVKRVETEKVGVRGGGGELVVPVPHSTQQQTPPSSPRYQPTNPASQASPSTPTLPLFPTGSPVDQGQYQLGPPTSTSTSLQFETSSPSFQAGQVGQPQAGPSSQTRPSSQPGPSTFIPSPLQATSPSLQNPFQSSPSNHTASPFHSYSQSPAPMADNPSPRPARWAMSPQEVDQCIFNIMNNLNPLYLTDVFTQAALNAGLPDPNAMLRTSLTARRAGVPDPNAQYWTQGHTPAQALYSGPAGYWEDLDPPTEPIFLTERQQMRLGFAIHKLGSRGLKSVIEFTRYVCLRNLMAAWEEPDVDKIWHKYKMKGADLFGGIPYSLNRKVQVLMTHIERAEEYCTIQLQNLQQKNEAEMTKKTATLKVDQESTDERQGNWKGKEKAFPSHENSPPGNALFTGVQAHESGEAQGKGKGRWADKRSPGKGNNGSTFINGQESTWKKLANSQLDLRFKSFVTILQLARIWNEADYGWFVDTLQDFGFPKMMRARYELLESDMQSSLVAKWPPGEDSAPVQDLRSGNIGGGGGAGGSSRYF
ncbi:hypothetical protein AOL_s00076g140 [Orbilia oligospora ATCC 24927]|uniref:Uncharacterized protein n=1 Tax=Arthrobotrys oligospora (strain ATCC 24927 / CBS 115.81 / DSM 1491) TaxID=756982 RepID=G1X933_ARTOA|nr:hypothetical protein AOL_s00076g140 [Orbilia oligospora ATCC 24927]EGX50376.1 hypothetical protein AOL_s00076g140 [Orbilia oligospora ATCC 24927]